MSKRKSKIGRRQVLRFDFDRSGSWGPTEVVEHAPRKRRAIESRHIYFAYGSNLSTRQMEARCPGSFPIDVGFLHGWRLSFTGRGVATILRDFHAVVPGVAYNVSGTDLASLDRFEGHPNVYGRRIVPLVLRDGSTLKAITYVHNATHYTPPIADYFETIREAYESWALSDEHLARAVGFTALDDYDASTAFG